MPTTEASIAVRNVWALTLAKYKKDLSPKDLLVVGAITSPNDIARHIEHLEARTHTGKSGAFADRVHAITGRLTQFSNVIDAMTSSNTEASLIWGSLKLLLTIVQKSSEEYVKICQSILAFSDSFPIIELLTETFNHSELVCDHTAAFYITVLRFWSKALNFYKRRRLFNIFRAWHDFDSEFGDLDRNMKRLGQNIEKAAAAVHMNESRTARLEQTAASREIVEAKRSAEMSVRHRDIVHWLAPTNYEASYYVDDRNSAYDSRHPGTCTWILDRPEFDAWMNSAPDDTLTRMLWTTGIPGSGKTVLSAFVINKCSEVSSEKSPTPILFFFFKNTDSDKNSFLAVSRSLLFQLYSLFPAKLAADIIYLRDNSGKEHALSDQRLWDLFVMHAKHLTDLIVILDALDECDDVEILLRRIVPLLQCCHAKIFVASRREENISLALEDFPRVFIGQEDIETDIRSYVTAEIKKIPRFQGNPVQRRMISAITSGHGGMFLWAYLMVKELKELGTVKQVDNALKSLPTGLEEMHGAIITRLDSTLRKAHRDLAIKILTWIVCAVRPLRLGELQEILRFEIRQGRTADHALIDDDDDLLYSEQDIELACGALVLCRNETLQLIHLSTKEILTQKPNNIGSHDSRVAFYVDAQRENPRMAILCASYMSTHMEDIHSITRPNLETAPRLQFDTRSLGPSKLITGSPFMNYASLSWQAHLLDGEISLELDHIMRQLRTLLTYDFTMLWIELCVSLHSDITWTLERSCKEIISWADYTLVPTASSCHEAIGFLWAWANAVVLIINEYGRFIEEHPFEIHFLDLEYLLSYESAPSPAVLPPSYITTKGRNLRERMSQIGTAKKHQLGVKVEPYNKLQSNLQDPSNNHFLGLVLYDSTREVFFSADHVISNNTEVLWVQERATGRRLQPTKTPLNVLNVSYSDSGSSASPTHIMFLITAVLSCDRMYLAILYGDHSGYFVTSIWMIERHLEFRNIRDGRPWARRLHSFGTENSWFLYSCLSLTAGQDGFFYCPSGQIHPEHAIQERIPDYLTSAERNDSPMGIKTMLSFAGDGHTIIRLDMSNGIIQKIGWLEDMVTDSLEPCITTNNRNQCLTYLKAVSQTARFVVYANSSEDEDRSAYYLFDTQGGQQKLGDDELLHVTTLFYFSRDERSLLNIREAIHGDLIHVSRWALIKPGILNQTLATVFIPGSSLKIMIYEGSQVCVAEDNSKIVVVDSNRVWHELDLSRSNFEERTLVSPGSGNPLHRPYCQREHEISSNGCRLVEAHVRCPKFSGYSTSESEEDYPSSPNLSRIHMELMFLDLSGTSDQRQRLELEYTVPELKAFHFHIIRFSPDLSLVQAGPHVFDLSAPVIAPLSFTDSPICWSGQYDSSSMSFSACNGYLVVIESKGPVAEDEFATFGLFQIHRTSGTIRRIAIPALNGMVAHASSGRFHPTLPLLVLTWASRHRSNVKGHITDISEAIEVVEIDLLELKSAPINFPRKNTLAGDRDYELNIFTEEACYSDCGSFCFLQCTSGALKLNSTCLERWQAKAEIPAVWGQQTSYDGRHFQVGSRKPYTMVELYQAIRSPFGLGFCSSLNLQFLTESTIALKITPFPIHLFGTQMHILVGKDRDDLVRILFLPHDSSPPEIKFLRVTMAQILAILNEAERAAQLESDEFYPEDGESSEEESSTSEPEAAATLVNEDEMANLKV